MSSSSLSSWLSVVSVLHRHLDRMRNKEANVAVSLFQLNPASWKKQLIWNCPSWKIQEVKRQEMSVWNGLNMSSCVKKHILSHRNFHSLPPSQCFFLAGTAGIPQGTLTPRGWLPSAHVNGSETCLRILNSLVQKRWFRSSFNDKFKFRRVPWVSLSSSSGMIRIHLSLNEGSMKGKPYPSQQLYWERKFKPYSPTCWIIANKNHQNIWSVTKKEVLAMTIICINMLNLIGSSVKPV